MRIAGLIKDDIVDCDDGICVSLWMQGCPHHCKGCHNPESWSFDGGILTTRKKIINSVIESLTQNGIKRAFSVLGGEPLCKENRTDVAAVVLSVRRKFPDIKIYIWTGYIYENLIAEKDIYLRTILKNIDILIDGPFILEKRDITLKLRGSTNQRVINLIANK